jgi:integral membrane protein
LALNAIRHLRWIGFVEGWSFLILLGIAMPLKYFAEMPLAVRIAGAIHGVLFIWYVWAVLRAARVNNWPSGRKWESLAASIWPFGTFVFDRKLAREEAALTSSEFGVRNSELTPGG